MVGKHAKVGVENEKWFGRTPQGVNLGPPGSSSLKTSTLLTSATGTKLCFTLIACRKGMITWMGEKKING